MITAKSQSKVGRPPDKRSGIEMDLRRRIAVGEFKSGDSLPHRRQLQIEYDASSHTVQHAMDALKKDGFIDVHGRSGTLVKADPPFRQQCGLAFPRAVNESHLWSIFYSRLSGLARNLDGQQYHTIRQYSGYNFENSPGFLELVEDIEKYRLSGIIHPSGMPPSIFSLAARHSVLMVMLTTDATPFMAEPRKVEAMNQAEVHLSYQSFFRQALQRLAAMGKKRPALLMGPRMMAAWVAAVLQQAVALQMDVRPYWLQYVPCEMPEIAQNITHLLFNAGQSTRPDSLVIADDNLLPYALQGLKDAEVAAGSEIAVIAHANFPLPIQERRLPVIRLGFDLRKLLFASMELLREWQDSGPWSRTPLIEAEFGEKPDYYETT